MRGSGGLPSLGAKMHGFGLWPFRQHREDQNYFKEVTTGLVIARSIANISESTCEL